MQHHCANRSVFSKLGRAWWRALHIYNMQHVAYYMLHYMSHKFHILHKEMTFLEEIQEFFGTQDLYEVLGAVKGADNEQIKKAYRKSSLKIHPDRVDDSEKEQATKKFQVLAKVHFILSDDERRKLYDNHGIIANDDSLEDQANWSEYWRLLFPKISEKDIQAYLDTYTGSKEEEEDLIAIYERFEGDLDKISQTHISYDEDKTTEQLRRLIDGGKIKNYKKFASEPQSKRNRRRNRAQREAKQAEKMREDDSMADLTALIKKKSQNNFDSLIANLEAKYSKGTKRKR